MKRKFILCSIFALGVSSILSAQSLKKIIVGATPVPHAEILEKAKPILAAEGIDLQIKVFTDYVTPNLALNAKDLDANFFQHAPYLDDFNMSHGLNLVSVGSIHFEPLGLYSKKINKLSDLKDGDKIAVPNDLTNEARALLLLQDHGLLVLKDPKNLKSTVKDIQSRKVKIKIVEIEAAQLSRSLTSVAAAVINGNYAIDAGLNPAADAIVSESATSVAAKTYANIVVVRKNDEGRTEIKKLISVLKSESIKRFIKDRYKNAIMTVD
jgi:D-methionine transport system substrate-binding protein